MIRSRKQVHYIKIWLFFVVGLVFFVNHTFAANACSDETLKGLDAIKNALMWIGDIASWMWILLGNFAGKLMTNTLIYGEFMNFDIFLWKIWQISRTFANYALWFLFLYHILKYLLLPSAKADSPTKIIKKLLISSVLIQASRFLVMATVDISTIGLATISSFPSQVISNSQHLQNELISELKKDKVMGNVLEKQEATYINVFADRFDSLRKEHGWEHITIDQTSLSGLTVKSVVDNITPKADNLAWPLIYMGLTVIQTHTFLREYNIQEANCVEAFTKIITSLVLDAGMIILYAFALAILVIILIVRVLYLWIFIALSPIIVLLSVGLLDIGKVASFLDRKKVLKLIFQPILFALWVSIMFLFIAVVQGFLHAQNGNVTFDNGAVTIKESFQLTESTKDKKYYSELSIGESARFFVTQWTKSLWEILLTILTLAMMRYFIKLALTSGTGISGLDGFTKKVTWLMETAAWNIGVIPTPIGNIWFKQVWDGKSDSSPLLNTWKNTQESKFQKERDEQVESVQSFLGVNNQWMRSLRVDQSRELSKATQNNSTTKEFIDQINKIKQENRGIRFTELKQHVITWIDNKQNKQSELRTYLWNNYTWSKITGQNSIETEKNLEKLFNTTGVSQNFYENVLGGDKRNKVSSYNDLNSILGEVRAE